MRYNHFDMLPEQAFQRDASGKIKPQGGGGSSSPSKSTVTQTNIPEYARPYAEEMLGRAQALTDINQNPFQAYTGQRFAGFSPMQAQAFQQLSQQQVAPQLTDASNIAYTAAGQALGAQPVSQALQQTALGYGQAGAGYGGAASQLGLAGAQQAQMAAQQAQRQAGLYGLMGSQYGAQGAQQAGQVAGITGQQAGMYGGLGAGYGGAAAGLAPQAQQYGGTAAGLGMQGVGIGGLGIQAAGQGFGAGRAYQQMATSPEAQQAYMSPYMQNVVEQQQKDAVRQAEIARQTTQAQAARVGAFGGSRSAIVEAENQRNLQDRLAQIQAAGSQQAFQQAQQAQQFGAGLGIQGLQAGYQGLQTGLAGTAQGIQGQQAGLAGLGQAGQLYGLGMTGAGLGLQGIGQQIAAGQLGLAGTAQGMQGAGLGLQGVGQQIAGGQLGLQGTQAGIAGQQAGIQGAQAGMQGVGQAVGAGQYGLQGAQTAISGAGQLGQLGQTQYAQEMGITDALQKYGALQQQQQQQALDFAYQQYLAQQQYPYQQLSYMSDLLRGVPSTQSAQYMYQQQPAVAPQLLGAGLSAYGAFARAKGGRIPEPKRYAAGGQVTPDAMSTMAVQELPSKLRRLSDTQLAAYARTVKDAITLSAVQGELNRRTRSRAPMAQPQDTTVADDIAKQAQAASLGGPIDMAGGGIVALSNGGEPLTDEQKEALRMAGIPEGFATVDRPIGNFFRNLWRGATANPAAVGEELAKSQQMPPRIDPTVASPHDANQMDMVVNAPAPAAPAAPPQEKLGITGAGQQNVPPAVAPRTAPQTAPTAAGPGIMGARSIIPGSFEEYRQQIGQAVQRSPEDQKLLDDMANRVKSRMERAGKQEGTAKYDAIMMAGLAMMGGTSLADGIAKAAQMGGATFMQGKDKAAKAMEAAEEADMAFQKYKIALDRNDKKEAADMFKDYSSQLIKLEEIAGRERVAQINAGARGGAGEGITFQKAQTALNANKDYQLAQAEVKAATETLNALGNVKPDSKVRKDAEAKLLAAKRNVDGIRDNFFKTLSPEVYSIAQQVYGFGGTGGANAPAAGSASGINLPSSKADLVKGQTYNTARGPAVWDGSQFVK